VIVPIEKGLERLGGSRVEIEQAQVDLGGHKNSAIIDQAGRRWHDIERMNPRLAAIEVTLEDLSLKNVKPDEAMPVWMSERPFPQLVVA
jgi:hypothetical protein